MFYQPRARFFFLFFLRFLLCISWCCSCTFINHFSFFLLFLISVPLSTYTSLYSRLCITLFFDDDQTTQNKIQRDREATTSWWRKNCCDYSLNGAPLLFLYRRFPLFHASVILENSTARHIRENMFWKRITTPSLIVPLSSQIVCVLESLSTASNWRVVEIWIDWCGLIIMYRNHRRFSLCDRLTVCRLILLVPCYSCNISKTSLYIICLCWWLYCVDGCSTVVRRVQRRTFITMLVVVAHCLIKVGPAGSSI